LWTVHYHVQCGVYIVSSVHCGVVHCGVVHCRYSIRTSYVFGTL